MLAVLRDKQKGLVPAVAAVVPPRRHPFCQAHSLRNLAAPLAEAEAAFKGALRSTVREHVGDVLRQEPRTASSPTGVLTVTGLVPSALEKPTAPAAHTPTPRGPRPEAEAAADAIITQLFGHTR